MTRLKPEFSESYEDRRSEKLEKRKHPRGRRMVGKAVKKDVNTRSRKERIEETKTEIGKILVRFENLNQADAEKQKRMYFNWLKETLTQEKPILLENDIKIESFISSVKAGGQKRQKTNTAVRLTHLPTLIRVKNEEERTFEQNRMNALDSLENKLIKHLGHWQILFQEAPFEFSPKNLDRLDLNNFRRVQT